MNWTFIQRKRGGGGGLWRILSGAVVGSDRFFQFPSGCCVGGWGETMSEVGRPVKRLQGVGGWVCGGGAGCAVGGERRAVATPRPVVVHD